MDKKIIHTITSVGRYRIIGVKECELRELGCETTCPYLEKANEELRRELLTPKESRYHGRNCNIQDCDSFVLAYDENMIEGEYFIEITKEKDNCQLRIVGRKKDIIDHYDEDGFQKEKKRLGEKFGKIVENVRNRTNVKNIIKKRKMR